MKKNPIVLQSPMPPDAVADALRRSMDEETRTLFSLSGYKGDQDILGKVVGSTFHLQKRRYWRNDFAPHFYGEIQSDPGGTRIVGRFDLADWVRLFMWFWLGCVVLIGGSIFVACLSDVMTGSRHVDGDAWVGLVVPPAMVLFGILLPRFGRLMGRGEERFILEHLQNVLNARIEDPALFEDPALKA
jgi:hypothetical protein